MVHVGGDVGVLLGDVGRVLGEAEEASERGASALVAPGDEEPARRLGEEEQAAGEDGCPYELRADERSVSWARGKSSRRCQGEEARARRGERTWMPTGI